MVGPDLDNLGADRVAVVYADGQIVDGEGYGEEIYGNTLAAKLAGVREDEKVKAVVLRVNSPGGSALASDVIWREMELLKAEKPVVVSMGSYAASGGYYISCPADVIVADRTTLTGSIGVFGMFINPIDALKNKAGRHARRREEQRFGRHGVRIGADARRAGFDHARRGQGVRDLHGACGRGAQPARRTGARDRRRPRVVGRGCAGDRTHRHLRRSEDGHRDGRGQGGMGDDFRVVEVREEPTGLAAFLSAMNVSIREAFTRSELETVMKEYGAVREATRLQGILMYSPCKLEVVAGRKPCRMTGGGFLHGNPPPVSSTAEGGKRAEGSPPGAGRPGLDAVEQGLEPGDLPGFPAATFRRSPGSFRRS